MIASEHNPRSSPTFSSAPLIITLMNKPGCFTTLQISLFHSTTSNSAPDFSAWKVVVLHPIRKIDFWPIDISFRFPLQRHQSQYSCHTSLSLLLSQQRWWVDGWVPIPITFWCYWWPEISANWTVSFSSFTEQFQPARLKEKRRRRRRRRRKGEFC